MSQDLSKNPFSQLFASIEDAEEFIEGESQTFAKSKVDRLIVNNEMIEKSLLVTFDKDALLIHSRPKYLLYMSESHECCKEQAWICLEQLDQVLFERRLVTNDICPIMMETGVPVKLDQVTQRQPLHYFFESFVRACKLRHDFRSHWFSISALDSVIESLYRQSCLYMSSSYQLGDTQYAKELVNLIDDVTRDGDCVDRLWTWMDSLLPQLVTHCSEESEAAGTQLLTQVLSPLWSLVVPSSADWDQLCCVDLQVATQRLAFFVRVPAIAEALLDVCTPPVNPPPMGSVFSKSPLGLLLRPSHLNVVSSATATSQFFNSTLRQEVEIDEARVNQLTQRNRSLVGELFLSIFKAGASRVQVKAKLFRWIGACLQANSARAQLGQSLQNAPFQDPRLVPDGFLINLFAVLCRLSGPLLNPTSLAVDKIQTEFVADERTSLVSLPGIFPSKNRGQSHFSLILMRTDLFKETRLGVSTDEEDKENDRPLAEHYSALSHLFFLLHKNFRLSFCPISERFVSLNRQNHELEQAWQSIQAQNGTETPTGQHVRRMMQTSFANYLSHQTALSDPDLGRAAFGFLLFSAEYLTRLANKEKGNGGRSSDDMPEFLVDNIVEFAVFMRRFKDQGFEEYNFSLAPLFQFVVVFMGSPDRLKNPHLRAKLAEVLEALIPFRENEQTSQAVISFSLRERLLSTHPLLNRVVQSLITAFVTIELTGEGVNFEEKFSYRRPMYACMRYFHDKPQFSKQFQELSKEALDNIDAAEAPLFLRFLNLLINDAIYLLDEALQHLALIKGLESSRAQHPGERFPNQQDENNFRHEGMLARYHFTMGRDTLDQLVRMAGLCWNILLHPVLVDRVAAMLNYFLVKLVGPKKRDFAVRDKEAYKFSPAALLASIIRLYVQLGDHDAFVEAVVKDDRSYTPQLIQATNHLLSNRLHEAGDLVEPFSSLTHRLLATSAALAEDETIMEEAPEVFQDEILGSVMRDPVLLPTSGQIVDRSTIARHLLSDTTDPFNRQPLTMSMVVPQDDLREQITSWIEEKRAERRAAAASPDTDTQT